MSSVSFKFSQSRERVQLAPPRAAVVQDEPEEENKDYLHEVDTRQGLKAKKKKEEDNLVIPCPGDSLESKAIDELLRGKAVASSEVSSREERDALMFQASLSTAGTETTPEDYDSVPIEKFGLAMLKGMGWTPDSKATVPTLEASLRPKGLGLGAALPKPEKRPSVTNDKGEKEELKLVVGAYVTLSQGVQKSKYGTVSGFHEDTGRAFVKLTLSGEVISISENSLVLVSKKEYKEKAKILNQNEYDRHAKSKKTMERPQHASSNPLFAEPPNKRDKKSSRKDDVYGPPPTKKSASNNWAAPHLRVRYINESFKKGRYFNAKMIIQDVTTPSTCVLKCESDGRLLEDVHLSDLETVIPKASSRNQKVMIVRSVGSARKGTLGTILSKEKGKYKALVQSLYDKKDVWNLDFDDLCEYFGELSENDDCY